jgi:esterase/lipase superfamily enzyme
MQTSWSTLSIAGHPADIYVPGAAQIRFAILFLHDLAGEVLRGRPAFTHAFDELALACICPQGGRCWWTERRCVEFDPALSPEAYLLDGVVPFVGQRWGLRHGSVGLLGIGMGGQGALRLAFKHPALFPAVAGISSALDFHEAYGQGTPLDAMYDSREQCRQDTALLQVNPTAYPPHVFFCVAPDDFWYRGNDRLHEKLSALGLPHEVVLTTRGGGHSWEYFERMAGRAVRFVHAGLVQESRRLL